MPLNRQRCRPLLKNFDLETLFVEELGWDRLTQTLTVSVDDQPLALQAIAEKRGLVAFECSASGDSMPDYPTRRRIHTQVTKSVREHLIVYTDASRTTQIWQWVRKEPGKPSQCREHAYYTTQSGEALLQKLQYLVFTLEEEEHLTIVGVLGHVQRGLFAERVTKRFYDRFRKEHQDFLKFVNGIPDEPDIRWYVSVILNRLMFIYFIQKKQFLNGDRDYLRTRLTESKLRDRDAFYSEFLCPLFFEGFSKPADDRSPEMKTLLGDVPYLNGGIFMKHRLELEAEARGRPIAVPDVAFERIFDFFDAYRWHLDEHPLRDDNEINPDVLGYIFEKYINAIQPGEQKAKGAYYTREDITGYISENTVIPYLLDVARKRSRRAFRRDGPVWRMLQENPDKYIHEAVRKGLELPLPPEVAVGLDDITKRGVWNQPASSDHALPTETWAAVVSRRQYHDQLRARIADGKIHNTNDLITCNIYLQQFAQDVIESCEDPDLLRAFWRGIAGRIPEKSNEDFEPGISILDPACGSGAFLFAALNILELLYEACLQRMAAFVEDDGQPGNGHSSERFADFKKILARVDRHSNHRYFVLKSIIISNLYGVDIMEEAVEICKL